MAHKENGEVDNNTSPFFSTAEGFVSFFCSIFGATLLRF
jgi:hypothetical protein